MPPQTLAQLKQQEKDARRQLILNAARDLFALKDFQAVTVREIARRAGVGVGTIYNYYENLDDLFLDIFFKDAEELVEEIDAETAKQTPSLSQLCRIYISYLHRNMTFYQMMGHFMLGGEPGPAATGRLNTLMRDLMDRIEGVIRKTTSVGENPRSYAHALFAALNGIMISYARYPGRTEADIRRHTNRLADIIASLFAGDEAPSADRN